MKHNIWMALRKSSGRLAPAARTMARILVGDEWFDELASTALYEAEFEGILFQEAAQLFPEYVPVPFKFTVLSDSGDAKADFALIHRTYRSWWVVEVEMGHHPFDGHVYPQVRSLSRAAYGLDCARHLFAHAPSLDAARLEVMVKGQQPRVLVVVNVPVPGWREQLRPLGAIVSVFQIFRSRLNRHLYRLNGDIPSENDDILTTCRCWNVHRFLKIDSPTRLPIARSETIVLHYEGRASEWVRTDIADSVLLHAVRGHQLQKGMDYEILRQSDNTFAIRPRSI